MCSKGKYSLDGRPPPSDIKPSLLRYLAAPFKDDGYSDFQLSHASYLAMQTLTFLALLSSLSRSAEWSDPKRKVMKAKATNVRSHLLAFGFPKPYNHVNLNPCGEIQASKPTGLLNISLLECAAIPPLIFGAFERLAATPFTLSLSTIFAI